ncbi:hypothetical protein ACRWQM_01530 [Shewanella sp. HL-SH5]|uniref:hypothetical protein n=1 Tax=Shewanella sp. HL-SH5 TaxID=3436241 RepID=UPI003EC09348
MSRIVPDRSWWQAEAKKRNALSTCPYANAHKCPRYFESLVLLSQINMIAGITENKKDELSSFWQRTSFSSLCDEEVPVVSTNKSGRLLSVSNFCPEVSFKYLKYYADYMQKYVDEVDKDTGTLIANRDNLPNDWRYAWMSVNPKFYLDCELLDSVEAFNKNLGNNFINKLHPNIIQQIDRMNNCLDQNDAAGSVHAASNVLETMAKDITNNPNVANQPLGGFFDQFKNVSKLPENLVNAVMDIYKLRNTLPTAGHGSLITPNITMVEAISICAMTKVILEIEYRNKSIESITMIKL